MVGGKGAKKLETETDKLKIDIIVNNSLFLIIADALNALLQRLFVLYPSSIFPNSIQTCIFSNLSTCG